MTFDQLEALEMIVEKGSFKAAAEHLNKTQPSLSVAIKKLEEEFSLLIFNRDEYRPKLTEQGLVFYNWAKGCLQSFRELKTVGNELGNNKVEPFLTVVIDPLARFEAIECVFNQTLLTPHPTELTLLSEIMNVGMDMLLSGEVDFAVAPKMREHNDIESVAFDKIEMIPVIAKSLKKNTARIDEKWLNQHPQIVVLQSSSTKDFHKRDSKGVKAGGKKCFVTTHDMKHNLIFNRFGWGHLPYHEIKAELKKGDLVEIKNSLVPSFTLDLHIMRSKLKPMGPVARDVWAELQKNAVSKRGR